MSRCSGILVLLAWSLPAAAQVTFRNGVSPSASYAGTRDVTIVKRDVGDTAQNPNANYNDSFLQDNSVDGHTGKKSTLMKWDVSAIPAGSTVTAASITLDITDFSSNNVSLYEVLKDWVDSEATWNEFRTGQSWTVSGARGLGSDRASASIGTLSAPGSGPLTIALNATGVALVQRWVNTPASNRGIIAQNLGIADALKWSDSSDTPATSRPKLSVTHSGGTVAEFQNGALPDAGYTGQSDTFLAIGPNYVSWDTLGHALTDGTYPSISLIAFDVSSIPAGAVVTAVSLQFQVQRGSAGSYPIYEALMPWTEEATWDRYDGTNAWNAAGASSVDADRGSVLLGSLQPSAAGQVTVALNADGVQLVQDWVSGAKPNQGFVIERDPAISGIAFLRDSEDANTFASRPGLIVTYQSTGATQLGFVVEPSSVAAGASISPGIQVAVQDSAGQTMTASTQAITLALGANPGGATLSGTLTVNAVDGVATFSDIALDTVGSGYDLVATASGLTPATSAAFAVTPGPAHHLRVLSAPVNGTAGVALSPALQVAIEDANGNLVSDSIAEVALSIESGPAASSLSGTLSVPAAGGVATFSNVRLDKVGSYTLVAASTGLTSATTGAIAVGPGTAASLAFTVQPSDAAAGALLTPAVQVEALDAFGNRATGFTGDVTVALAAGPLGAALGGTTTVAAVAGVASFNSLAVDLAGSGYALEATSGSLASPASATFTITGGAATQLAFTGQPSDVVAGQAIAPSVVIEARDAYGNLAAAFGGTVTLALLQNPGGATLGGTLSADALNGVAVFSDLTLNRVATGYTVQATATGVSGATSSAFAVIPGSAHHLVFLAAPPDGTAGAALNPALQVSVEDALGNRATGSTATVTLAIATGPGGASLSGNASAAAAAGLATFANVRLDRAGSYTLSASSGGLTGATSATFSISAGVATQLVFTVPPSDTTAGQAISPAVQIEAHDAYGNRDTSFAGSVTVGLDSNPGLATLAGTVTVDAVAGIATFADLFLDNAGLGYTLEATAAGPTPAFSLTFAVGPGPAHQLRFLAGPADGTAGTALNPAIQVAVEDVHGNRVTSSGANIVITLASGPPGANLSGTGTVAASSGVATFSDLRLDRVGSYTLSADSSGLTGATSASFSVAAGAASQLVFAVAPSDTVAGQAIAPAVQVEARDAYGNLDSAYVGTVTMVLAANPGGATLTGTVTANALDGVASFAGLVLDKAGTGNTLQATASGLTSAMSDPFAVTPAAAHHLRFIAAPANGTAGSPLSPALQVAVEDAYDNRVTGSSATIALGIASGPTSASLSGTPSVTAVAGLASFADVRLNRTGSYTLSASSTGLSGVVSTTISISADAATQLAFAVAPSDTSAGQALSPAVQVEALDAYGNRDLTYVGSVTVALGANPGGASLSGSSTATALAGLATFSNLVLDKVGAGYTLQATAAGPAAATSGAFAVTPAAAHHLRFVAVPANGTAGVALSPALQVAVEDAYDNRVTGSTVTVTLSIGSGPSGSNVSGTPSVAAVAGLATFADVRLDRTGSYTLSAASPGILGASSNPISVAAGSATQLAFVVAPSGTVAGQAVAPAVQVEARDAYGNRDLTYGGTLTVALGSNPGGATLSGTLAVNAVNGVATFANLALDKVGTGYTVQATASGLSAATSGGFAVAPGAGHHLRFVAVPANGTAGVALSPALTVAVEDAYDNRVTSSTATVAVSIGSGPAGSNILGTSSVPANAGLASFSDVRLNVAGTYVLTAATSGLSTATSSSIAIGAGAATQLVFRVAPSDATAGQAIAPTVEVEARDAFGNRDATFAGDITLALAMNPGGAVLSGALTVGALAGVASFPDVALNKVATGYSLQATASGPAAATSGAFSVTPAPADRLRFVAAPPNGTAGISLSPGLQVSVEDAYGNRVTSSTPTVSLAIASGPAGASLSGASSVAAASGLATFVDVRLDKAGSYTIAAAATGLSGATSTSISVAPGAATQLAFLLGPSDAAAGQGIAPAVQVEALDGYGNRDTSFSGSILLTLGTNPGGATLAGALPRNAVGGVATFADLALDKAGTGYTLEATASGPTAVTSAPFAVVPAAADHLRFVVAPANGTAGIALSPALQVAIEDAYGNRVSDSSASVAITIGAGPGGSSLSGTASVAAVEGLATFSDLQLDRTGSYTLAAGSSGLAGATSGSIAIGPGAATQLAFAVQPSDATAGQALSPTVRVEARDAYGNLDSGFTGSVALALGVNPSAGTLSGTQSASAVGGVASFANLAVDKVGSGYTLQASASGLTGATSAPFAVAPGVSSRVRFAGAPANGTAGAPLAPGLQVVVEDAYGNRVSSASSSIALSIGSGPAGASLSGISAEAANAGLATLDDVRLDKAGSYTLVAASTGLASDTSAAFTIAPAAASLLVFSVQPNDGTAGELLAPAVEVEARDAFGNRATDFTGDVLLALDAGPLGATLGGTTTAAAVGGAARFPALAVDVAGPGYVLAASSPGLTGATSSVFAIAGGPATQLAFVAQPSNVLAGQPIAPAVVVEARDAYGNRAPAYAGGVTVSFGANPGGSTLGGSVTAAASAGTATFALLTLDRVGAGYTLSASATGLSGATSTAFDVSPAAPAALAFVQQPMNAVAGVALSPAVSVEVRDAYGNRATGSSALVGLTVGSGPVGAVLGGTTSVAAVAGVATFSGLVVEKAGAGYTLEASATALTGGTSSPFDIGAALPAGLAFTSLAQTVAAGACSGAVAFELRDAFGNVSSAPSPVTVTLATSSTRGSFSSAGGCGNSVTAVGVAAGGTGATFYFSDEIAGSPTLTASASGLTPATQGQQVLGGVAARFVVSGFPATTLADAERPFSVQALDAFGNPASYAGTVSFRSSDALAVLPSDYAFLPSDTGGASFTARLRSAGLHSLTVVDRLDAGLSGEQSGIRVDPGAPAAIRLTPRPITVSAGAPVEVELVVQDGWGNVCSDYVGSLRFTATDSQAILAAPVELGPAEAGRRTVTDAARFYTPGTQTLTLRDSAFGGLSGSVELQVEAALAPAIARDANPVAAVGQAYRYNAVGRVRASGATPITFSRCAGPSEVVVEPASGTVRWTPTSPGPVGLCLRAENAHGADRYDFTVQVSARNPTPVLAAFEVAPSSGAAPLAVSFDGSGSTSAATAQPLMFQWSFGDGSVPGAGPAPQHVYRLPGGYRPRLVAYDAYGAASTAEGRIEVLGASLGRPPSARIVASEVEGSGSLSVTFHCDCQAGTAPLAALRWDLGQGTATTEDAPAATYGPGRYHVKLVAVDSAGLTSSDTVEVVVRDAAGHEPPECEAYSDPVVGRAPLTGRFLAQAAGSLPLSFSWTLEDGTVVTGAQVERMWDRPGRHGASLVVEDATGLRCHDRAEVVVLDGADRAPPRIVQVPGNVAQCGRGYSGGRPVAEGEGIVWSIQETSVAGLTIDPVTGELRWRPHPAQSGPQRVIVTASNSAGTDRREFAVEVDCSGLEFTVTGCGCRTVGGEAAFGMLGVGLLAALTWRSRRRPARARP